MSEIIIRIEEAIKSKNMEEITLIRKELIRSWWRNFKEEKDNMIRKLPKEKFVIHCKETKYYMVEIEADNYEQAVKQWETIAKRRNYTTLHRDMETQSVSQEV